MGLSNFGQKVKIKAGKKALEKLQSQKDKFIMAGAKDDSIYESFMKSLIAVNIERKKMRKYIYEFKRKR